MRSNFGQIFFYFTDLLSKGINRPRKGHDAGDHPPITPMRAASRNELDGDSWKIYDYVRNVNYLLKINSNFFVYFFRSINAIVECPLC